MAEFESPQSRNEAILQNILGANNDLLPPESRIDTLLQQLLAMLGGGGDEAEVDIDLGFAWNVGVVIPILSDQVASVSFS